MEQNGTEKKHFEGDGLRLEPKTRATLLQALAGKNRFNLASIGSGVVKKHKKKVNFDNGFR
jgi:hypothetical protein